MPRASTPDQQLVLSGPLTGFARLLDQRGRTGAERLAAFERLPEPAQELAWESLRRAIDHGRDRAHER